MDYLVGELERVRRHLEIDKWALIGNSNSTYIALYYAVHFPENVSRAILTGCEGTDNSFRKYLWDNIECRLTKEVLLALEKLETGDHSAENEIAEMKIYMQSFGFDRNVVPAMLDALPEEERRRFFNYDFGMAATIAHYDPSFDMPEEVYASDVPIRIIQGRQDPVTGDAQVILNERARNSRLIFIERAGHLPWLEQPEAFFAALRESLTDWKKDWNIPEEIGHSPKFMLVLRCYRKKCMKTDHPSGLKS
jgi:proline iminopeptidase